MRSQTVLLQAQRKRPATLDAVEDAVLEQLFLVAESKQTVQQMLHNLQSILEDMAPALDETSPEDRAFFANMFNREPSFPCLPAHSWLISLHGYVAFEVESQAHIETSTDHDDDAMAVDADDEESDGTTENGEQEAPEEDAQGEEAELVEEEELLDGEAEASETQDEAAKFGAKRRRRGTADGADPDYENVKKRPRREPKAPASSTPVPNPRPVKKRKAKRKGNVKPGSAKSGAKQRTPAGQGKAHAQQEDEDVEDGDGQPMEEDGDGQPMEESDDDALPVDATSMYWQLASVMAPFHYCLYVLDTHYVTGQRENASEVPASRHNAALRFTLPKELVPQARMPATLELVLWRTALKEGTLSPPIPYTLQFPPGDCVSRCSTQPGTLSD